ncbi:MAG: hypothetical protein ACNA71_01660, partial [Kiritimatiellia bacterium]
WYPKILAITICTVTYICYSPYMTISMCFKENRKGQVMLEFIIVASMLILTVSILSVLLYTFKENTTRVLQLVGSEYP